MTGTYEGAVSEDIPAEPFPVEILEGKLNDLIEAVKENQNHSSNTENLDGLIDLLEKKELKESELEQKELEKEQSDLEKEEKENELMDYLLNKDDLTEEEQEELDLLIEEENSLKELESDYYNYMTETTDTQIQLLGEISSTNLEIVAHLEEIKANTESVDQLVGFYGYVAFPAIIITYGLWRIVKPFI